eukprot:RCo039004
MASPNCTSPSRVIKHEFEDEDDLDETEEVYASNSCTAEEERFDRTVGKLEEILLDDEFTQRQQQFFAKHCGVFSADEENKLSYTEIFKSYVATVEGYLTERLSKELEGFNMAEFSEMLRARQEEVSGDIWELLLSFTDFLTFKELILAFKAQQSRL